MKNPCLYVLFALAAATLHGQVRRDEIPLWEKDAAKLAGLPKSPAPERTIRDVTVSTLTPYLPEAGRANGTAVIVCPGGAFRILSWEDEGVKVAEWLNSRGIAAFVLKYRTLPTGGPAGGGFRMPPAGAVVIRNANANPDPDNQELNAVIKAAIEDGKQAIRLVRQKAAEWQVDPRRVGIMGFSAGGGVVVGTAVADQSEAYPDFAVSIYGPSMFDVVVPGHGAPLFIATSATHPNVADGCLALYSVWKQAGKPVEIHLFDKGPNVPGAGLSLEFWSNRFHDWLTARGLVPRAN